MAWGIVMTMCYFLAAVGLLILAVNAGATRVPVGRIDPRALPAQIPDIKKAA